MVITIRKASVEDAYEYTACHAACWIDAYSGLVPDEVLKKMRDDQGQRAAKMRETLQEPGDCEFYCVEYEGKMIGRLIFGKCRDEDRPGAGEIHAIYLLAEYWDKGFGRQMLEFALGELKTGGYREIIIWVFKDNGRARNFYEKHGFVFDGAVGELVLGVPLPTVRYLLVPCKV